MFVSDGRQALDSGTEYNAAYRFIRSMYSKYQSEEESKDFLTLLKTSSLDTGS